MATRKPSYIASVNLTVTNLHSLASSATYVAGWGSALIDNGTDLDLDKRLTAKITAGTTPTAGEIRLYLVGMLDDSTWPPATSAGALGTEGAITFTDTEMRDAVCILAAFTATDTTSADVYSLQVPSVAAYFGGNMPHKFVVFITHSMVVAFAASGNQVTTKGSQETI